MCNQSRFTDVTNKEARPLSQAVHSVTTMQGKAGLACITVI
jgi:hypothetical protein